MILYESPWIPRGSTANGVAPYFERPDGETSDLVCIAWLQQWWDVPDDAEAVQIVAHNRPSQFRVPVAISEPDESIDGWVRVRSVERPRQQWWLLVGNIQLEAQRFAGETVHVELHYKCASE